MTTIEKMVINTGILLDWLTDMANSDIEDGMVMIAEVRANIQAVESEKGKYTTVITERLEPPRYCNFCPHNENCQVPRFKTAGQYGFRHLATPNRVLWSNTNDKECRESYIAYLTGDDEC